MVVNYESNQIKLFESQSGSITEALTVLSYKDYANRLRSYIDANNFSADAKAEIMIKSMIGFFMLVKNHRKSSETNAVQLEY